MSLTVQYRVVFKDFPTKHPLHQNQLQKLSQHFNI